MEGDTVCANMENEGVKKEIKEETISSESIESTTVPDGEKAPEGDDQKPIRNENGTIVDLDRIQICNLVGFFGFKQFKKWVEKLLSGMKLRKIRHMKDTAYVAFESAEDAQKAIKIVDGLTVKKNVLSARLAPVENRKGGAPTDARDNQSGDAPAPKLKTSARESVTPLANVPYVQQLKSKQDSSVKIANTLIQQCNAAKVDGAKQWKASNLLQKIRPSPIVDGYRNKCEFTVGLNLDGQVCVGFVGGKFSKNQHYTLPVYDCDNMSTHTKAIVKDFQEFVVESGLAPFDELARVGTWKMLTVREFSGDAMMIVTVFPFAEAEKLEELKKKLVDRYLAMTTLTERSFRVTSMYISVMEHASDSPNYQLIGGAPYIYESVMDCRFRVSPSAFFQTNSKAATVLYTTIGEQCGFIGNEEQSGSNGDTVESAQNGEKQTEKEGESTQKEDKQTEEEGPSKPKRAKVEGDNTEEAMDVKTDTPKVDNGTILLDICCGTGTIGQCLLKHFRKKNKVCCVGIEMVESAVEDARQNAKDNGIYDDQCQYIAGKAEDTFHNLKYSLATGFSLEGSKVVGVLDPPRAGVHERVIVGCRTMSAMKKLVFVSCEPRAATNNIVALCRPTSNKYAGVPFRIETIIPVDMFPQTHLVEWVVTLVRD